MVSAKILAYGYQPRQEVKRGGKAKPYLGSQPKQTAALTTLGCPQQNTNQPTKNPHPPPQNYNPFFCRFLPRVWPYKNSISMYMGGVSRHMP